MAQSCAAAECWEESWEGVQQRTQSTAERAAAAEAAKSYPLEFSSPLYKEPVASNLARYQLMFSTNALGRCHLQIFQQRCLILLCVVYINIAKYLTKSALAATLWNASLCSISAIQIASKKTNKALLVRNTMSVFRAGSRARDKGVWPFEFSA